MKRFGRLVAAVITLALMVAAIGNVAAAQHEHHSGTPQASPATDHGHGGHGDHGDGDLSIGAAYLVIANNGDEADRLLSIETDAAEAVELHEVTMRDGVMQMSPLHDGLEIPAGEEVSFEPGGYHVMLIGLTESLIAGEEYELTLTFEHAGEVTLTVPILRAEPEDNEGTGEAVGQGDLTIGKYWSRQAPKLDSGMGTPVASPEATPAH